MAAPDLSFARNIVAGLLPDRCQITRNPGGIADDVLDQETMQLTAQAIDPWYDGPCLVKMDPGPNELEGIGQVLIPFDADADAEHQLQRGDLVLVTDSQNPAIRGHAWVVGDPTIGSFSVSRKARLLESRR
jgi:hypothetical protein